jgi:endonuclease-3
MASVSRTALFAKILKVTKKYYKPVAPPEDRSVLEHLLFACCLEDARYEAAEEAFAALVHTFFDWNEVRVTSLSELSEVMSALPDSRAAANRVKRILHGIFEELYSFDLEEKRKKNLGPTVKWLEKIDGATKFSVAYIVQSALGGHSIPVDAGTLQVLRVLDLVTEKDVVNGEVPGLERAIAKAKGVEFASLLHQLGADFSANPFSPQIREVLLQIDPDAAKRFPQRRIPRDTKAPAKPAPARAAAAPATHAGGRKKKAESAAAEAPQPPAAGPAKPVAASGKPSGVESKKSAAAKKPAEAPSPVEKAAKAEKPEKPGKVEKKAVVSAEAHKEHSTSEGLAKRKPR